MKAPWWEGPIASLDFEGTGGEANVARPVSVALLCMLPNGEELPRGVSTVIDCGVDEIPEDTVAVHGITVERMRAEGRSPADVFPALLERLEAIADCGIPLAIMNARYDWPLLHLEARRLGLLVPRNVLLLDPGVLDRQFDRYRRGKRKLTDLAQYYGVPFTGAHDAGADVRAAIGVTRAIGRAYPALQRFTLEQLQQCQAEWFAAWRDGLNAHWQRIGVDRHLEGDWPWCGIDCGRSAEQLTLIDVPEAPRPRAPVWD